MVKVLAPQGVTPASAEACYANDRALDKVVVDVQTGQALGVRSTPTLFINEENYLQSRRGRRHRCNFTPSGAVIV